VRFIDLQILIALYHKIVFHDRKFLFQLVLKRLVAFDIFSAMD